MNKPGATSMQSNKPRAVPNLASLRRPNEPVLEAIASGESLGAKQSPIIAHDPSVPASSLVVGHTYSLPLMMLRKSEVNARVFYLADEIDQMIESLRDEGQDVPAVGYVSDTRVVIVDGQKRFTACIQGGLPTLNVYITAAPKSIADEYETSRRINRVRSEGSPFDDAVRFSQMLSKGAYASQADLARRNGVSEANTSKILRLMSIPERLLWQMREKPQTSSLSVAYEISTLFSPDCKLSADEAERIAEDVITQTIAKNLGRDAVSALIKSRQSSPRQRARADQTPLRFGQSTGLIKVFPAKGEVSFSIRNLSPEDMEIVRQRISEALSHN